MPVSTSYLEFILDRIAEVDDVVAKSMFGGYGLFQDERMFGIVADDTFYLKADNQNRRDFERAGMEPFRPYKDPSRMISYYEVPTDLLETPEALSSWLSKSLAAAKRG